MVAAGGNYAAPAKPDQDPDPESEYNNPMVRAVCEVTSHEYCSTPPGSQVRGYAIFYKHLNPPDSI